ncbi:MAG: hypothetical protein K2M02_04865 [Duncaniella sp.]|nr:hypothetical protein [Duncaniella sp.]
MNILFRYIYLIMAVVLAAGVAGCRGGDAGRLGVATRLVHQHPDSAYTILRDIDYGALDADSLKARYVLTKAIADIRVGRSLVTDTLLADAAAYYLSVGDTADWVVASQLLSGYDLMRGESGSALRRLEEMLPLISSRELRWDTYIHLLEVSLNGGDYASACDYADRLLRNTDVPEQVLRFGTAKGAAQYMQGKHSEALAVFDSIIAAGIAGKVSQGISREFYQEYAEILDGAGRSRRAIAVIDSLENIDRVERLISLAQFHANSGNTSKAKEYLDSINHDATQSVFEVYASVAMLKAALQFKESGRFPSELMHKVTKNMQLNYQFAQFDRQTALESVMELNDDNYELKLQRQRLWLLVLGISIVVVVCGITVYFVLARRKQRMVEAEERVETLERMLRDTERADSSDSDKLKAALLRQLGIFKTFAGTPTPQSRDALKKISTVGNDGSSIESLVDWQDFYSMIDNLYDGFHAKLVDRYPGMFNDKEQQIIVLLKAGFSTKEIGVLTEQSSATIYTRKSVIRKKLGTPENGDFVAQIDALNNGA